MRDIKFKAWLKSNNLMYDVLCIDITEKKALIEHGDMRGYAKYPDEIELMQYTGQMDVNREEIYEGDIFIVRNLHNRRFKVIYDGTRFIGVNHDGGWICYVDSCYKDGSSRLEIIGNIYENPELLKEATHDI